MLNRYLAVLPKTHFKYHYLESLKGVIDKESLKKGFRPPSKKQSNKKTKKGKAGKKR